MLVLVAVRLTLERDETGERRIAWYDAGQAVAFLTLQATAMGLSVRQMEGFDRDARARGVRRARRASSPPSSWRSATPAIRETLDASKRTATARSASRGRGRPLGEQFVFEGGVGKLIGDQSYFDFRWP